MKENWTNQVNVEGYIYDLNDGTFNELQLAVTGEQSKNPGSNYIRGILNIATDDEGLNIVPVRFTYVGEFTKKGDVSPTFALLKEIIEEHKNGTLATFKTKGIEAMKVRISGNIDTNTWVNSTTEQMVTAKEVSGSFINRLNTEISKEPARFNADLILESAVEHEEAGYVQVKGWCFNFRQDPLAVDFTVSDENGMAYFLNLDYPLVTNAWGHIKSTVVENKKEATETAWGQARVQTTSRTIRTWEISGSSPDTYLVEDGEVITEKEFAGKKKEWQARLDDTMARYEARKSTKSFPTAPTAEPKKTAPKRATKTAPVGASEDEDFGF